MTIRIAKQQVHISCIYCGGPVSKVRRGEHIIPESIGGNLTISEVCRGRTVCKTCNNGVLSVLDKELCSLSPISFIASHELDSFVWQTWDVDHSANNLLLEGRPNFKAQSITIYPQMVFEQKGPQIRGDLDQFEQIGRESFEHIFVQRALDAFRASESGEQNRLHFKRISWNADLMARYRYAPRIFARHSINEFKNGMSFELQYLNSSDKRFALSQLANWDASTRFNYFGTYIGSEMPAVRCNYEAGRVIRALLKIGINLLAAYCPNTPVDKMGFRAAVSVVLGHTPMNPTLFRIGGFVHADDLEPTAAANAGHSFRLHFDNGNWHIYSSFFGGRIGTFIRFPGPNKERWVRAEIVAPLKSKEWTIQTGGVHLRPSLPRIEYDPQKFMPSVQMFNVKSETRVIAPGESMPA